MTWAGAGRFLAGAVRTAKEFIKARRTELVEVAFAKQDACQRAKELKSRWEREFKVPDLNLWQLFLNAYAVTKEVFPFEADGNLRKKKVVNVEEDGSAGNQEKEGGAQEDKFELEDALRSKTLAQSLVSVPQA